MERSKKSHRSRQSGPSAKKKSDTDKKKRDLADDKKRDPSTDKKKRDLTDDKKRNPKGKRETTIEIDNAISKIDRKAPLFIITGRSILVSLLSVTSHNRETKGESRL
ncbi:unnamed protein product [Lactuca saligna]|uniref:Uncharacterized protein n=1 Tax=Lactuca saligna TaxID=75948 RepID=A0AA35VM47_LACSI|nr:unnamed protein product [Lactuca saligna]